MHKFINYLIGAAFLLLAGFAVVVSAQQKTPVEQSPESVVANKETAQTLAAAAAAMQRSGANFYRIGDGDEVEISVFRHPELSQVIRVNEFGVIAMPRIDDPIYARCKTESELTTEITKLYTGYLRKPHVLVKVKDYKSQPVAVMGAVDKPGQFYVNRKMRLLEALAAAGGPTKESGSKVILARLGSKSICEQQNAAPQEEDIAKLLFGYDLRKVLEGNAAANPWMQPGDVVSVMEADKAFVVGNVKEPKSILLRERRTLTQAIAEASGLLPASKKKAIFLIREDAQGNQVKTPYNLEEIAKGKMPDPVLKPNDVVEVPIDGIKDTRNSFIKAITNGLPSVLPFLF